MQSSKIVCIALVTTATWAAAQDSPLEIVEQIGKTANFSFSVKFSKDGPERVSAEHLMVFDRTVHRVAQDIDLGSAPVWSQLDKFVEVVDVNSDGHPDIVVPFADGGAGPNFTMSFYLYDSKRRQFYRDDKLSELPQPTINKDGTITSSSRGSCCQHSSETYRFKNGVLTLIANWDESYTADGRWIVTTTGKLTDGKWRTTVRKKRQPAPNL